MLENDARGRVGFMREEKGSGIFSLELQTPSCAVKPSTTDGVQACTRYNQQSNATGTRLVGVRTHIYELSRGQTCRISARGYFTMSSNSTSKISVAPGLICGGDPRSP